MTNISVSGYSLKETFKPCLGLTRQKYLTGSCDTSSHVCGKQNRYFKLNHNYSKPSPSVCCN